VNGYYYSANDKFAISHQKALPPYISAILFENFWQLL